jgi:hypothetical protein
MVSSAYLFLIIHWPESSCVALFFVLLSLHACDGSLVCLGDLSSVGVCCVTYPSSWAISWHGAVILFFLQTVSCCPIETLRDWMGYSK